jgi:hypothetical protein
MRKVPRRGRLSPADQSRLIRAEAGFFNHGRIFAAALLQMQRQRR